MKQFQPPLLIAIVAVLVAGVWVLMQLPQESHEAKPQVLAEVSPELGEETRSPGGKVSLLPVAAPEQSGARSMSETDQSSPGPVAKTAAGVSAVRLLSEDEWKRRGEAAGLSLVPRRAFIRRQIPVEIDFRPLEAARDRATGFVTFDLGLGRPVSGEVTRVVERSPNSYTLQGNLESDPLSEFSVSVQDDVAVGNFTRSDFGIRQLRYAGEGIHLVQEIEASLAPPCGTGKIHQPAIPNEATVPPLAGLTPAEILAADSAFADDEEEAGGTKGSGSSTPPVENMAGTTLDVMVVYSTTSRIQQGGLNAMLALINQGIDDTNIAFMRSQVDAELRLVHTEEVSYSGSSGISALSALQSRSDGIMDQIHAIRDAQGADFVSMWHGVTDVCGVGYVMTNLTTAFASLAFNVTDPDCQFQHTFSHELGHNFGLTHAVGDAGTVQGEALYQWSHGWRWFGSGSAQYRSIMAYAPGTRSLQYSNPSIFYLGGRTGVNNLADSARSLNSAKSTLAAFRLSSGDDHGDTITSATLVGADSSTGGVLEVATDLDVFRITMFSADTLTVQTTGGTNTFGRLLNSSGGEIQNNANGGTGSNFLISRALSVGIYYVEVSSQSNSTGAYRMVAEVGNDDHGNDITSATSVGPSSTTAGILEEGGDEDFFRVSVPSPGTLEVSSTGSTNTYGYLLDSGGSIIQSDDNTGTGGNFYISQFVSPGVYFIRLRGFFGSTTGSYSLVVAFTELTDDHGDSFDEATTVTMGSVSDPASTAGELEYPGDTDFFRFTIPAADPVENMQVEADPIALHLNGFTEGNKNSLEQGGYTLRRVNAASDFYYEDGAGISSGLPDNGSGYVRLFADDSLEIVEDTGKAFDVLSMDLAEYSTNFNSPQSITWRGHKASGATETFTFLTDGVIDGTGPLADFEHVDFPDTFRDLVRLEAISLPCSVDNIVLEPSDARRVTIDIEGPPAQPPSSSNAIPIYLEKNFTLKPLGPIDTSFPYDLNRVGSGSSTVPDNGGAYLRLDSGDSLEVFEDSNQAFDAVQVDLAEYSTSSPSAKSIAWKGYKADGTTVSHTFETDGVADGTGPLADFETFVFPPSFQRLVRLEAQTDLFCLDNLVVVSGSSGGINQGILEISSTGSTDTVASLYNSSFSLLETKNTGGTGGNFLIRRDISPGTYYLTVAENGQNAAGTYEILFGFMAHEPSPLADPASVTATDDSPASITVSWDLLPEAESYSVHRHTANNPGASTTLTSGFTGTSFVDTTAAAEVVYYYWVKAANFEEGSGFSLHDTGFRVAAAPVITNQPPNSPVESGQTSGLSVTATTGSGTISYQWYEGTVGDTSVPVGSNSATLNIPNQTANTSYWVRVSNHIGSTDSQTAIVSVLPNRPGRVIATENLFLDRIRITWESAPTAVSYNIYRGTSASFSSASLVTSQTTLHYDDPVPSAGTRYWYFIKAVDVDGDEGYFLDNTTRDGVRAAGPLNGSQIPIRDVSDLVFDSQSGKLYISTDIGTVEQYDVASRTVPKSFYAGSSLRGIDITPDDSTVLVADLVENQNSGKGFIHRIVPASDTVTALEYNLGTDEGGSFDVGIFSNSFAFVTTEMTASTAVSIRELNPASGLFTVRADAPGSGGGGLLGDRSVIVRNTTRTDGTILESNEGSGPWFGWDQSGGTFGAAQLAGSSPFRGAVNRDGTLVALSNYPDAKVFAPNGALVKDLTVNSAAGMCFSPLADELYVADFQGNRIRGYDTATWQEEFNVSIPGGIVWNPQFGEGTLEISPDGRMLALATDDEIRLFDISARVTAPVPPATISATDSLNDRVTVNWGASPAADSYSVYRNTVDDSGSATMIANSVTGFTWNDFTAVPVTSYFYWVEAANAFGEGGFSASDAGVRALVAPTGLTATNDDLNAIAVDWSAEVGVPEYWIYRNTAPSGTSATRIAIVTSGGTYADNGPGIVPGRDYYYFARAAANGNPSPYSAPAVGRLLYSAPEGLVATDAYYDDKVRISWSEIGGALEYAIYRNATAREAGAVEIARLTAGTVSHDDTSATPGTPYFYSVRAVMPGGEESVFSDWVGGELSAVPTFLPDERIGKSAARMIGDGVYNTNGAGQTIRLRSKRRKLLRFHCALENDGAVADTLKVVATRGNRLFRASYFEIPAAGGRVNVTAAAITGSYTAALGPGEHGGMQLDVKRKGKKKKGRLKRKVFSVITGSQNAPERKDAVKGKAESG